MFPRSTGSKACLTLVDESPERLGKSRRHCGLDWCDGDRIAVAPLAEREVTGGTHHRHREHRARSRSRQGDLHPRGHLQVAEIAAVLGDQHVSGGTHADQHLTRTRSGHVLRVLDLGNVERVARGRDEPHPGIAVEPAWGGSPIGERDDERMLPRRAAVRCRARSARPDRARTSLWSRGA